MIGIASLIFDSEGAWIFRSPMLPDGVMGGARRVSRTATLDGGVAVTDLGYSDGDRDLDVKDEDAILDAVEFAKRVVENYTTVTVSTADGAYRAVPSGYDYEEGILTLKLLITEKISE